MSILEILQAAVALIPGLIQIGINVSDFIGSLRKAVDAAAGKGDISQADAEAMHSKMDDADAAWAARLAEMEKEGG